ncbi:MAG: sugar phosphate isomerase/epimerase [Cyclobacteriaceae bacterium]|nr:sugar phosphate isomerase/epimerase [Cyclobacteriaceae bacterium]
MNYIKFSLATGIFLAVVLFSCTNTQDKKSEEDTPLVVEEKEPFFKISLAQWSLHIAFNNKELDPFDFAQKASELGFEAIEYVSFIYQPYLAIGNNPEAAMQSLLDTLKAKSETYGVKNVLIMVDREGPLATSDENERNQSVENHKKWIDAAAFLGCHSIRVNLNGSTKADEWVPNSIDALKKLSAYGQTKNINVVVENHGGLSSNAKLLTKVISGVGMSNCGTLPDFGNFCIKQKKGVPIAEACVEEYDKYTGTKELMVFAKAVSAKSNVFDENGNESNINYVKMLQIVKDAGYTGYIGVEYEGSGLSEIEGIEATKKLLLKAAKKLK